MPRLILTTLLLLWCGLVAAQTSRVEYFFDTDPGPGNAIRVNQQLNMQTLFEFDADLDELPLGPHVLYVRACNDAGVWSMWQAKYVFKPNIQSQVYEINAVEYFIDVDPGTGNGLVTQLTPGTSLTATLNAALDTYTSGPHMLYVRARNTAGVWSMWQAKYVFKPQLPDDVYEISSIEYFVDTDPGAGSGTAVQLTPGSSLTSTFSVALDSYEPGPHVLYTRARNAAGVWSMWQAKYVFKPEIQTEIHEIDALEYFIDTDPGPGQGIAVNVQQSLDLTASLEADLQQLNPGYHVLYVRACNTAGAWSQCATKQIFCAQQEVSYNITAIKWYFSGSNANTTQVFSYTAFTSADDLEIAIDASLMHLTEGNSYTMHLWAQNQNGAASMQQQKQFVCLFKPANVKLSADGTQVYLNWDVFGGASYFRVFYSPDIENGWRYIGSSLTNTWQGNRPGIRGFYRVTAFKN